MSAIKEFWWKTVVAVLLAGPLPLLLASPDTSPPAFDTLLRNVLQRAKAEGDNDRAFDAHYRYLRTKVTEFRNSAGQLKKREANTSVHVPATAASALTNPAPAPGTASKADPNDDGAVSDTHSNVRGQQIKKSDIVLNEDLVSRFVFTIVGQERLNGRPAWVVDFVPANKPLPERNLKERFINKAAGRVWIDAADYSLVKGDLHLTQQVNVGWGLIAAVWKFYYHFERQRTADGLWYPSEVDWHLEGREVIINRIVDYHETTRAVQKFK
ncbi:MAG TPA: hypothetical protein VMA35_11300 [Candidatus Sulfopaludibacter sp.]|nr:hypothetical protein [Candidatus Sulfopaludibacter sp.]